MVSNRTHIKRLSSSIHLVQPQLRALEGRRSTHLDILHLNPLPTTLRIPNILLLPMLDTNNLLPRRMRHLRNNRSSVGKPSTLRNRPLRKRDEHQAQVAVIRSPFHLFVRTRSRGITVVLRLQLPVTLLNKVEVVGTLHRRLLNNNTTAVVNPTPNNNSNSTSSSSNNMVMVEVGVQRLKEVRMGRRTR